MCEESGQKNLFVRGCFLYAHFIHSRFGLLAAALKRNSFFPFQGVSSSVLRDAEMTIGERQLEAKVFGAS